MRRWLVIVAVAAQVLVLVFMMVEREYVVHFGKSVFLRTAPLDPRDPFRGDYVRLDYEISWISPPDMQGTLAENRGRKGLQIYTVLSETAGGLAHTEFATDVEPTDSTYLRGRLTGVRGVPGQMRPVRVKYGIEQMFVEQWKGKQIEARRGLRDGLQVPLEVEIAIAGNGKSVLTGYRWSRLGIQLVMLRLPERDANDDDTPQAPRSPRVQVTLQNASDRPLALVNPGDNCAFELVALGWTETSYEPVRTECEQRQATAADVRVLEPGETYETEMDLSDIRWHVSADDTSGEIGRVASADRFRLIYRAPDEATAASLSADAPIWLGQLPSRAFNAFGRID